jgi:hypothetical protein
VPDGKEKRRTLDSWKEVADYLGITVRTAQKWESEWALPIQRKPGARGRIFAYSDELDNWKECTFQKARNGRRDPPSRLRFYVLSIAVLAVIAMALGVWAHVFGRNEPFSFRVERFALVVNDSKGQEIWRKPFSQPLDESIYVNKGVTICDIDGDGHQEVLFMHHPSELTSEGATLICFNWRGNQKWRFVPGREVHSATESFPRPYRVWSMAPIKLQREGIYAVVITSIHTPMYPTQVALLSAADGHLLRDYWHSGYLEHILVTDFDGDGQDDILLGGCNNAYNAATLIMLDPHTMGGASVEEDSRNQLVGFGPGTEKVRILFPRSCINRKFENRNWVSSLELDEKGLRVNIGEYTESGGRVASSIYKFDHTFRVVNCQFGDDFRIRHAELEATRQLDHHYSPSEDEQLNNIRRLR